MMKYFDGLAWHASDAVVLHVLWGTLLRKLVKYAVDDVDRRSTSEPAPAWSDGGLAREGGALSEFRAAAWRDPGQPRFAEPVEALSGAEAVVLGLVGCLSCL